MMVLVVINQCERSDKKQVLFTSVALAFFLRLGCR
jgi:hypothetical protein